jgi:hypothetical protein
MITLAEKLEIFLEVHPEIFTFLLTDWVVPHEVVTDIGAFKVLDVIFMLLVIK